MGTPEQAQGVIFASPIEALVAQISWREGQGWRLWVSSWDAGQTPSGARSSCYERLTASELLQVMEDELRVRCDWLAL